MTSERYGVLITYKAALDDAYKRINPLSIQRSEYEKTLAEAKLAGFKVMRNSDGVHKLIDKTKDEKMARLYEQFARATRT